MRMTRWRKRYELIKANASHKEAKAVAMRVDTSVTYYGYSFTLLLHPFLEYTALPTYTLFSKPYFFSH